MTAVSFSIDIPDAKLQQLQAKLKLATLPDELDDAGWDYGAPLSDIKRLVNHWKSGYSWRDAEADLNAKFPQFTTDIDVEGFGSLNIHFVHKKSERVDAIPLLFLHGWPGCFLEVSKILPLLTAPASEHEPAFHVVAPSLPGYGFSQGPGKKGFALDKFAETFNKLMLSLGYDEYATQGGDWGSFISRRMALLYGPKHVKAWHVNLPQATFPSPLSSPFHFLSQFVYLLNPKEIKGLIRSHHYLEEGSGYFKQQATRPDTLGYGLEDSPVGLLAWIYEKLVEWTDGYTWTDDEVLTWISIYWFSRAGSTAASRIYYEAVKADDIRAGPGVPLPRPSAPNGVSIFPKDVYRMLTPWVKAHANVVFMAEHRKGGHFAAWEVPEVLVGDLRKMFGRGGAAFGVVGGRNGF
ncbi:Alpha/Beta hydrolase protein [Pterulicium gracile]|uniref:Alpha/Beta hydrolase protein n=1 Tax=Pterulicium gracile TaxID=1884261 RepID=A0A5C3Q7A7_9AGAR|nr:Alpha/Beta hydrolase protein [Pterula gracilis]